MSISPPSDIVLDVARAADPVRLKEAAERLKRLAPTGTQPFAEVLEAVPDEPSNQGTAGAAPIPGDSPIGTGMPGGGTSGAGPVPSDQAKAFQGFEAMALSTFIEAAMPEGSSALFGSGTAGNVWKSMLAEQISQQMARAGGIGIAKELAASVGRAAGPQAEGPKVTSATGTPSLPRTHLAVSLEKSFLRTVMPDLLSPDDTSKS